MSSSEEEACISDVSSEEEEEPIRETKKKKKQPAKKKQKKQDDDTSSSEEEEEEEEEPKKKSKHHHHHHKKDDKKKKKKTQQHGEKKKKKEEGPKKPPSPYIIFSGTVRGEIKKSGQPGFVEMLTPEETAAGRKPSPNTFYSATVMMIISGGVWGLGDRKQESGLAWLKSFFAISAFLTANKSLVGEKLFAKHKEFARYILCVLGYAKYMQNLETISEGAMPKLVEEFSAKAAELIPQVAMHVEKAKALVERAKKTTTTAAVPAPVPAV